MVETLKKKQKVSKKTKRSWRKHVDIQDVNAFLDNKRLEERLGLSFTEKPNEELFVIDTEGKRQDSTKTKLTKQERRLLLKNAEPKCYSMLKSTSAVPDPISKRNTVKKQCTPKRKCAKVTKKLKKSSMQPMIDAWENEVDHKLKPIIDNEWLDNDTKRHVLSNTVKRKKRIPTSLRKKSSEVPAVTVPHPGTSYNPSYEDHQNLLQEIATEEKKLIKEERHLERVTSQMFRKVTQAQKMKDNLAEMSEGLPSGIKDESSETEDDTFTVKSINPPVKRNKKTSQQRRKQKELKRLQQDKLKEKVEKKKIADLYKLNKLSKKVADEKTKKEIIKKKRDEIKKKKAIEPKVLSRHKFEPLEKEFLLGTELSGNLRALNPTSKLLKDRYKSLQHRNIVAPGIRLSKSNKPNTKRFVKADHKINLTEAAKKYQLKIN